MKYFLLSLILFAGPVFADNNKVTDPQMRYNFVGLGMVFDDRLTGDGLMCGEDNGLISCYRVDADQKPEYFTRGKHGIEPTDGI